MPSRRSSGTHGNKTNAPRPRGSGSCWRRSISIPNARCSGSFLQRDAPTRDGDRRHLLHLHYRREMSLPAVPVILLDADLDPLIAEKFMPGLRVVEIPVIQQAHIVQVIDRSCSMRFLLGAEDGDEREHSGRPDASASCSSWPCGSWRVAACSSPTRRCWSGCSCPTELDAAPRQFAWAGQLQASRYGFDRRPAGARGADGRGDGPGPVRR